MASESFTPLVQVSTAARIAHFLQDVLARPELAIVPESCAAETALHKALKIDPLKMPVNIAINDLIDLDARENYTFFTRLQQSIVQAASPEQLYLQVVRITATTTAAAGASFTPSTPSTSNTSNTSSTPTGATALSTPLTLPPDIFDLLTEHIVGHMMQQTDALEHKNIDLQYAAAQWLFTRQTVQFEEDRLISSTLDLSHEMANQLSHGLVFRMSNAKSGLKALAQVLERWIAHLLGIPVTIRAMSRVDDPSWRWHIGLEATSTAILNDLYLNKPVSDERLKSLISLFRLDFNNPDDMRLDVAGKPVYLGLAFDSNMSVKIKPQNLVLNLPLNSI